MRVSTLYYVARDDEKVSPYFLTEEQQFAWLLRHQGQSVEWATTHEGYSFATMSGEPWTPEEQQRQMSLKGGVMRHDHGPVTGDREERNLVRANCGACVLDGYRDRDDDEWPRDEPNYAGWARVYVELTRMIPVKFMPGFERAINEDSPYGEALRRDILTYGVAIPTEGW